MKTPITLSLIFTSMLGLEGVAQAYCFKTTCGLEDPPASCPKTTTCVTDAASTTEGIPLHWPNACVSFSVLNVDSQKSGITADELETIVSNAFAQWSQSRCLPGKPNISVLTFPQVSCDQVQYNQNSGNANVWMFRDDDWPHEGSGESTIAITTVTADSTNGEIYDADVEFNSYAQHFTLSTTDADIDLPSVVQHEAGHFLGLDHSQLGSAVMYPYYSAGQTSLRTLSLDDAAGLCELYTPRSDGESPTCSNDQATPRHGFSSTCGSASDTSSGCCSIATGHRHSKQNHGLIALGTLGILCIARRKSPRPTNKDSTIE